MGLPLGEPPVGILVVAVGTRIGGDVDGFGLAPPHVGPQAAVHDDVGERHVGDGSLIAVLYAQASVAGADDAVGDGHIIYRVHVLRPNLHGARARSHGAVGDDDVVAGAILGKLASVFQADAVVARGNMAVGDAHIARMVDVDAVAIAYLQVVEQVDAVDHHIVASHEMHGPIGSLANGDVAQVDLLAAVKREHMGTRIERGNGFQLVGVAELSTHESHSVAINGSPAREREVAAILGPEPEHALALVFAEGAEAVKTLVGMGLERGRGVEHQFDVRFQLNGACQESVVPGKIHLASSIGTTLVDGALDGRRVVGLTIAAGTISRDIIYRCLS